MACADHGRSQHVPSLDARGRVIDVSCLRRPKVTRRTRYIRRGHPPVVGVRQLGGMLHHSRVAGPQSLRPVLVAVPGRPAVVARALLRLRLLWRRRWPRGRDSEGGAMAAGMAGPRLLPDCPLLRILLRNEESDDPSDTIYARIVVPDVRRNKGSVFHGFVLVRTARFWTGKEGWELSHLLVA